MIIRTALILIILVCAAKGATYEGMVFNVKEFGAVGDNKTDNTEYIQNAIDACSKAGGGVVLFPENTGIYQTGSIWLTSNLIFVIESGATLKGIWKGWNTTWQYYPPTYSRGNGVMMTVHAALINGAMCYNMSSTPNATGDQCTNWGKLQNVTLTGGGTIDGTGAPWWQCHYITSGICPDGCEYASQRPTLLGLLWIDGLYIQDLYMKDSPFWQVHPTFSQNIRISNIEVYAPASILPPAEASHETDGIHLDSCHDAVIDNVFINTGDDNIALTSGDDEDGRVVGIPTYNVVVKNSVFLSGHGASIGSGTAANVTDILFTDITMNGTEYGPRVKSARGRGGWVKNVTYQHMTLWNMYEAALLVNMYYLGNVPPTNASATPHFDGITFRNISAFLSKAVANFSGLPESLIENVYLEDVYLEGKFPFFCIYAANITQNNMYPSFTCNNDPQGF